MAASDITARTLEEWAAVGLEAELGTLAVTMRLLRTVALVHDRLEACVVRYGFRVKGDFDTLAILRRCPVPMSATKLAGLLMVTPPGMTSRFDRLEEAGAARPPLEPGRPSHGDAGTHPRRRSRLRRGDAGRRSSSKPSC